MTGEDQNFEDEWHKYAYENIQKTCGSDTDDEIGCTDDLETADIWNS